MHKSSNAFLAAAVLALLTSAFAAPQARAQTIPPFPPTKAMEGTVETSTEDVLLPTSTPGTITFRNCAEPCSLRTLSVTGQSLFFVGSTQVALADFNAFLRGGGLKPLTVFHEINGTNVTRVVVIGQLEEFGQTKQTKQTRRTK